MILLRKEQNDTTDKDKTSNENNDSTNNSDSSNQQRPATDQNLNQNQGGTQQAPQASDGIVINII